MYSETGVVFVLVWMCSWLPPRSELRGFQVVLNRAGFRDALDGLMTL